MANFCPAAVVPLKSTEYGVYGDLPRIYPKPYLKGSYRDLRLERKKHSAAQCKD